MENPLFDLEFLSSLLEKKDRILYIRIILLDKNEYPLEHIEGKATGGSINIDGKSSLRRSCTVSMIAKDININDFYWGLKNKFKLEIGIKNDINGNYGDIIWFKQGIYVITSFNTSRGVNNYTINISGKDKMCLLNGNLGGILPHTTDFGIEEYYDSKTGITTYTSIPIKNIIREAVQNFGGELAQNIIVNDIEDAGLELLEYRGDIPLFLLKEINSDVITNMTINGNQPCYINENLTTISQLPQYDNLINLGDVVGNNPTIIRLTLTGQEYTVVKVEYGDTPGYRLTDLTYAGDLIANVGETITSVLDKIVNMLGSFEYFYNLDGKFVFQKKPVYVTIPGINNEKSEVLPVPESTPQWSFLNSQLINQFQNTPKLDNLKNDFSVWGKKKTASGSELDIHMRYAIDIKPTEYTTLNWYDNDGNIKKESKKYSTEEGWDWRELIYQMALDYRQNYHNDDFLYNLAQLNPQFPEGLTGYEQYYTDLEGFWRELYNPNPEPVYEEKELPIEDIENIYTYYLFRPFCEKDKKNIEYNNLYIEQDGQLIPFLGGFCKLTPQEPYGYFTASNKLVTTSNQNILKEQNLLDIYIVVPENALVDINSSPILTSDGDFILVNEDTNELLFNLSSEKTKVQSYQRVADSFYDLAISLWENGQLNLYLYEMNEEYIAFKDMPLKDFYMDTGGVKKQIIISSFDNYGELLKEKEIYNIKYFIRYYKYDEETHWIKTINNDPENLLFWFDFLDAEGSYINKYNVKTVGVRPKAINDKDVKAIYYKEIPQVIFQIGEETFEHQTGYTYVQLQGTMENLFIISSRGKSAKEKIEELLYLYSYCIETISLTAVPIYHLEPNSHISVRDDECGINSEYLIDKITLPLTYSGTMNISATRAVSDIK